jgi:hypothetical protein
MAYNRKYYFEFADYYNDIFRVEILGRDFEGEEEEIIAGENPLIVSYPGDDRNLFNPIIGSEVKLELFSDTNFKFISLHNSDARAHRVDIYKNEELYWQGWILPDLFSEPYIAPPYIVTISARCGLGELQEIQVEDLNLIGAQRLIDIFKTCLLKIETISVMNESINVYYDSTDTVNDSPLDLIKINIESYFEKSCYEMLSDIALSFGARLYQQNCEWNLIRAKEVASIMTFRKWDLNNDFFVTYEDELRTFLISRPAGSQIVNESPMLDILPAWKKFNWVQDLGKKESIVNNYDFSEWNLIDGFKNWTEFGNGILGTSLLIKKISSNNKQYAEFNSLNPNNYIYQLIESVKRDVSQSIRYRLNFYLFVTNPIILTGSFQIEIRNTTGSLTAYLKVDNSTGVFSWVSTPTKLSINNLDVTHPLDSNGNPTKDNFQEITFIAPGFNYDGNLEVFIYASGQAFIRMNQFSLELMPSENEIFSDELTTTIQVNEKNIYQHKDIELISGDLPEVINAGLIWENGYRKNDGYPTAEWHERSGEALPLLQLIGKDYQEIFKTPQFKLTIPILSRTIQFDSCIVDYLVLSKKYICASAEIDVRSSIFRGSYMEFAAWENAVWILEDGTWNDEGIWIDNGEQWNDDNSNVIDIILHDYGYHDLSDYLSVTDTILSLPINVPGIGGVLIENGVTITTTPYFIINPNIGIEINMFVIITAPFTFNVIKSGVQKTLRIYVT